MEEIFSQVSGTIKLSFSEGGPGIALFNDKEQIMLELPNGNICLPRPSTVLRKVAKGRREHFTGQLNVGPDEGACMDIESYTEFQVVMTLMARPEVVHVENQVLFPYRDLDGKSARHFFDFRATMTDGSRTAIMVKSAYRYSQPSVADELRLIASQVDTRFADQVVVMTETGHDSRRLYNVLVGEGVIS